MLADANTSAFLTHTNRILHAVPVPRRLEQSQLLEFKDKAAARRVGGVSEVLFQLLGGKLRVAVGRQDKLPQRFFLLCDLPLGQSVLERSGRLDGRKRTAQFMIYIFDKIDQERRCVQNVADARVFLHQCIGVVIALTAFVDILGKWYEQRRGIPLLDQVPQMH